MSAFRPDVFAGKRVVVTGGSSGIGLGISKAYAAHGAHVIVWSRSEERLKAACAEIDEVGRDAGGSASWHSVDVRDGDAVEAAAKAVAEGGPVDTLVNCAAGNFPVPFAGMSANAWHSVIDIVLNGTANVTRALGLRMLESGRPGDVINIVAGYAWTGAPMVSHSGAAKAGVLNLTKSLAVEFAPSIRVNAVSPGPIGGTEGMKRLAEDFGLGDAVDESVPLKRHGSVDEVASACLFLSGPAASYVTGVCLPVDGGQDARGPFYDLFSRLG